MDLSSVLITAVVITLGSLLLVIGGSYIAYKIRRNK